MRLDKCPICGGKLKVEKLKCKSCGISLEGSFISSPILNLPSSYQEFIEMFVLSSGSLKEMAKLLGVSYPTVRARLDEIISALKEEIEEREKYKKEILEKVDKKEISAKEAANIIKNL